MLARVNSVAHLGLMSVPIVVEVDVATQGFPGFNIVGLPSKAVEEAKEKTKTAWASAAIILFLLGNIQSWGEVLLGYSLKIKPLFSISE